MRISLFGYGTTMKALAARIACTIYDDKFHGESIDEWGNALRESAAFEPENSDLEIPSPGIMPTHPLIARAKHLCSEYDYFAPSMPQSIWISGTNGKTTTTEMTQRLFASEGALAGGNIGIPLANLDTKAPLWILETSSFMLHYTHTAAPQLYVLLPIVDDHVSWHGSFDAYRNAKLSVIARMQSNATALLPTNLLPFVPKHCCALIGYDNSAHLAKLFGIDTARVPFAEPFLQDALLALACTKILRNALPYELLADYHIGAHRQQKARDKEGRLWVNDSKATNIDATLKALPHYKDKKIHLIIGGDDKGANLLPLFESLATYQLCLYTIGSNEEKLCALAKQYQIPFVACNTLKTAVATISKNLQADEVALLSPASASLDQFSSYSERGTLFLQYANATIQV